MAGAQAWMTPRHQMAKQAAQICMAMKAAWPVDTNIIPGPGHMHEPWWKYSPWISTQILHAIGAQTET